MAMFDPGRLRRVVRTHLMRMKGRLGIAAACMVGYALATLAAPWPLKFIFDYVLLADQSTARPVWLAPFRASEPLVLLALAGGAIVLIALAKGMFAYIQLLLTSRIGYELVHRLRSELFEHLQNLSLSFHNRARAGELLTRVTSDTQNLRDVFAESALTFGAHLLTVFGMIAMMLLLNWQLALVALATLPLLASMLFYLHRRIHTSVRKQRRRDGHIAARLGEMLAATQLIQTFAREADERARFESESGEALDLSIQALCMEAAATRTIEIISAIGVGAVALYGALLVLEARMTAGDLLVFVTYVSNLYKPMRQLTRLSLKFTKAAVSAERLSEILDTEPEILDRPDAVEAIHLKGRIEFRQVSFSYAERPVFTHVSFTVEPGERVALVGPSGAGKSTLTHLILRLYDPQAGAILIDGRDLREYQRASLRRNIGVVLQDTLLFGASIRENILYGRPDATQEQIDDAARAANAYEFIETLPEGYDTLVGERGATLSGGQRQRLCLARAVIKNAPILLLDEATSAVDAHSEAMIQDAMVRLQAGKTVILIAHRLSSFEGFDRVLVLKDGSIEEARPEMRSALLSHSLQPADSAR